MRVPRRPDVRVARLGRAVRGARGLPHRRRAPPVPRDPGRGAAAVRGRRRRAGRARQRAGAPRRGAEPVRDRRVGQDRDRRLHLAPVARRRGRRHHLDPPARSLDAEPRGDPARPGDLPRHGRRPDAGRDRRGIPRRPLLPARGRRHHAEDRSRGHAHHGQGAHARTLGARGAAHHRRRRAPRAHLKRRTRSHHVRRHVGRDPRGRPRGALRRRRPAAAAARARLDAGRDHAPADPGGLPVLRRGPRRLRRGDPRGRRREEPPVPADALRQLARRLGADDGARRPRLELVRRRARHQGMGRRCRAQSGSYAARRAERPARRSAAPDAGEHGVGGVARLAELAGVS